MYVPVGSMDDLPVLAYTEVGKNDNRVTFADEIGNHEHLECLLDYHTSTADVASDVLVASHRRERHPLPHDVEASYQREHGKIADHWGQTVGLPGMYQ